MREAKLRYVWYALPASTPTILALVQLEYDVSITQIDVYK